jgi:D-glycero-D-manno-heptose 1,7-bisphosphate phosphatase
MTVNLYQESVEAAIQCCETCSRGSSSAPRHDICEAMKRSPAQRRWAVFLDRDGVINRKAPEGSYVTSVAEVEILEGVGESIARLNACGVPVVVITNQRGVARGLMTAADLDRVHAYLEEELARRGALLQAIYSCVHDKGDQCDCRKPRPGNILRAAEAFGLDLSRSWMVGDRESDILAGRAAGCRTILLTATGDDPPPLAETAADEKVPTLTQAVDLILQRRL